MKIYRITTPDPLCKFTTTTHRFIYILRLEEFYSRDSFILKISLVVVHYGNLTCFVLQLSSIVPVYNTFVTRDRHSESCGHGYSEESRRTPTRHELGHLNLFTRTRFTVFDQEVPDI